MTKVPGAFQADYVLSLPAGIKPDPGKSILMSFAISVRLTFTDEEGKNFQRTATCQFLRVITTTDKGSLKIEKANQVTNGAMPAIAIRNYPGSLLPYDYVSGYFMDTDQQGTNRFSFYWYFPGATAVNESRIWASTIWNYS